MGCRHSTPLTRGGAAPRPKLVHVRAAPRAVRDSASSLEAGQLSSASGSPDSKRLGCADDAEEDEDEKKTDETEKSFAARPSTANPPSDEKRGRAPLVTLKRGTPIAPVTDRFEDRADRVDPMKHPIARATDSSPPRKKTASPTRVAAVANGATRGTRRLPLRTREFLDDDVDDVDVNNDDVSSSSSSSATSVLLMSTFDGTVSKKETMTSPASASSEESLDALLRETRALLNRTAPGRFGNPHSLSLRESILGVDKEGNAPFEEGAERVPVLEAYDAAHASRRQQTRGALASSRRLIEYFRLDTRTSLPEDHRVDRTRSIRTTGTRTNESFYGERRVERAAYATTEAVEKEATPFERVRRRSAEREMKRGSLFVATSSSVASRNATSAHDENSNTSDSKSRTSGSSQKSLSFQTQTLQDGATRRRLAAATATLARVEAARRVSSGSAAHPARTGSTSLSHAGASADRARRLGDVLAEFRARGERSAFPDENVPSAIRDVSSVSSAASSAICSERMDASSSSFSRRARFFAPGFAPDAQGSALSLDARSKPLRKEPLDAFISPTVRATPLTSGALTRVVAPMSEKMRRARSALRSLQIPGAEPPAPRRARVAAQAERVSSVSTFVTATTQRGSAHNAAACAARPASHLGRHCDRYG